MRKSFPLFLKGEVHMADMSFDFNQIKRSFFRTTLKDGRKLVVKMPMKKTFQKLAGMAQKDVENMTADDGMDTMAGLCAEILSNNMNKEKVTAKYMSDDYDMEEMGEFLRHFMEFCNQTKDNPN